MMPVLAGHCAEPDSVRTLQAVEVQGASRANGQVGADGNITLDAGSLRTAPRTLGEADLLRRLLSSAGVNTISDYSSGAAIDGMSYANNLYSINGVPAGFPYHFGGIFSAFNSRHYPHLTLQKSVHDTGTPDCLGGLVDIYGPDEIPRRTSGSLNVGMMASSLSLRQPVGSRTCVSASARVSYIDQIYGPMLRQGDYDIGYGFHDIDLDILHNLDAAHTLRVWGHYNHDFMHCLDDNFNMMMRLKWHNAMGGVEWRGPNGGFTAGYSETVNTMRLSLPEVSIRVPSSWREAVARGHYGFSLNRVRLTVGAAYTGTWTHPQRVSISGYGYGDSPVIESRSTLLKVPVSVNVRLAEDWSLDAGVDLDAYFGQDRYRRFDADPRVTLRYIHGRTTAMLHVGRYHQFTHQVGMTEIGMASNFRICASRLFPEQQSVNFALGASHRFDFWNLTVSGDVYYKLVYDVPEYTGMVMDFLNDGYRAQDYIDSTDGYNTGVNVTVSRDFGSLTASLTYGFCVARRRLPGSREYFTASSQIQNALNVTAGYVFNRHWDIGVAFGYGSGRPITPVRAVYFIGQRLMMEYGKRNSGHLPAYHRLDIGGNYRFRTGRVEHTVSLAVLNVYGHSNVEVRTYRYNPKTQGLKVREVCSLFRFLPSLSYTIDF